MQPGSNIPLLNWPTYVQFVRDRASEPDLTGRWTNALILEQLNIARQQVMIDFQWPTGSWFANTSPGIQEYSLGDLNNVVRAYMQSQPNTAPQPLVYETINALEGDGLGLWDQTAPGFAPQWMSQAPASYPVASDLGYPVPVGVPWLPNASQRPKYYLRGGHIGILPAPSNVCMLQIDVVPEAEPFVLGNTTQTDILPWKALDAVVWKTMFYMASSTGNTQKMVMYEKAYSGDNGKGGALGILLSWKREFPEHRSRAPLFTTYRTRFQGPPRFGGGTGRVGR